MAIGIHCERTPLHGTPRTAYMNDPPPSYHWQDTDDDTTSVETRAISETHPRKPRCSSFLILVFLCFPGLFFIGRHTVWNQVAAERGTWLQERNHQRHLIQEEWSKIEARQEEERRDQERRQRAQLSWVELKPQEQCLGYGARMYSARLVNLPFDVNKAEWCMQTDITIHGFEYTSPDFCEVIDGEYYGHWAVRKGEAGCATYFSIMNDKGECVPGVSHLKRYVGKLENFPRKDWGNWRIHQQIGANLISSHSAYEILSLAQYLISAYEHQ